MLKTYWISVGEAVEAEGFDVGAAEGFGADNFGVEAVAGVGDFGAVAGGGDDGAVAGGDGAEAVIDLSTEF